METKVPSKLLSTLSRAADVVRGHGFIHAFSHYDADGVSSATIIATTLMRAGKEFRMTLFPTLNDMNMDIIRNSNAECVIVTDLGASYIKQFDEMDCDVVVLDHHPVTADSEKICYANPHLYGIDGMTSGCGATMALLFSVAMDEANWDLVQIAFAGIAGDRQHINGLSGLNTHLLEEGVARGFVKQVPGSLIPPGKLSTGLYLMTDPYIRGVSGSREGVEELLKEARVSGEETLMTLGEEDRRRLSSLIAIKLIAQGVSVSTLTEAARDRYFLTGFDMDAEYLSTILDKCGRAGLGGMGIAAGMKDPDAMKEGIALSDASINEIVTTMVSLDAQGLNQMDHIQWFDCSEHGYTGILCGICMQSIGDPTKPTICLNQSNDPVNISSRGTWSLLDRGVNLTDAMTRACASVGGQGGGHKIAAGGSIPQDRVEEFLKNLDKIIEEQVSSSR